jgi:hypothetical protein
MRGARWIAVPTTMALLATLTVTGVTSAAFADTADNQQNTFAASTTFGPQFVRSFGTSGCSTTTTTLTVPAAGVAAGNTLIVRLMLREPDNGAVSVADSVGNTYSVDATVQGGRTRTVVASAYIATGLTAGQTITITHPNNSKVAAASAAEFRDIAPTNRIDTSVTASSNSATPTASVTTTHKRSLVYAAHANRDNVTLTEAAGWTTDRHVAGACAGQFADDHGAYRAVRTPATVTYNPTLSAAKDWTVAVVAYKLVDKKPPAAPTLTGNAGDGEASLSWTTVTDPAGVTYKLYRGNTLLYSGTATSFTDTPLVNGTSYTYTVYAVDGYDNTSLASNVSTVTPSTGASITFVRTVGTQTCGGTSSVITVPSGGVAKGSTLIVSLVLREPTAGAAVSFADNRANAYTIDANLHAGKMRTVVASAYMSTALAAGDTVTVTHPDTKMEAVTVSNFSGIAPSGRVDAVATNGADSATPTATLTATMGGTLLFAALGLENAPVVTEPAGSWLAHQNMTANCGGSATSHTVYRKAQTAGAKTYNPTLSGAVSWTEALVAYKPAGADTTAPAAPTLSASAGHQRVTVSWGAVGDDRSEPVSYRVYRDGAQVYSGTATSYEDTGLTNGTQYTYTARAVDAVGNASALSAGVNATPTADTTPPAAPVLSGTKGTGDNSLTWTAVSDATTPVTYRLRRGTTVVYEGTATTYTDTVNGSVTYTVRAVDGALNESVDSNALTPAPGTVSAAVVGSVDTSSNGYVRQGGGYYVYANVTAGSTRVTADVSAITTGQTAVVLEAGTYTRNGVNYGFRSALLTAANPLTAGAKSYSVTPSGGTAFSGTVTVDNTAPAGADIQMVNKAGGSLGVPETGDQVVFTFTEQIDPASILAGWTGTSTSVTVYILQDGSDNDTVSIRNSANTAQLPLGTVDTNGDPVSANATFTGSTMVQSGSTVTVTLGTINTGARTDGKVTPSVWTPQAGPVDFAGHALTLTAVTESGASDPSF